MIYGIVELETLREPDLELECVWCSGKGKSYTASSLTDGTFAYDYTREYPCVLCGGKGKLVFREIVRKFVVVGGDRATPFNDKYFSLFLGDRCVGLVGKKTYPNEESAVLAANAMANREVPLVCVMDFDSAYAAIYCQKKGE